MDRNALDPVAGLRLDELLQGRDLEMAQNRLGQIMAPGFVEPENYNPAMVDHYGRRAQEADGDWYGHAFRAGVYAPLGAIALASISPYNSRFSNGVERMFGVGFGGMTALEYAGARAAAERATSARRHQADYASGGRSIAPEELAEMFRRRPPMSR